ncbi:MAG: carbohydrate kinase family protein [Candidatus Aminicenantales bacterium]
MARFGLLGTITHDVITREGGRSFEGLGGVLYQAAGLCALKEDVSVYSTVGKRLMDALRRATSEWKSLNLKGLRVVEGPGNEVRLHYPVEGERQEILKSVGPPYPAEPVLEELDGLDFFVFVLNSGFDMALEDWGEIKRKARCPVWLDIHSLALEKRIGSIRTYASVPEWTEWARDVTYIQANTAEVAACLGMPGQSLKKEDLDLFASTAKAVGAKAVFVTLGAEGVWVSASGKRRRLKPELATEVADSTGCGDVFCAATAARLQEGANPFDAASYGMHLASEAVGVSGISGTYRLLRRKARNSLESGFPGIHVYSGNTDSS